MKKFARLAALCVAAAMTVSMSFAAFVSDQANTTIENGSLSIDVLKAAGDDVTKVDGAVITFTVDDSEGFGGGFMMNSDSTGWLQQDGTWDWGNPDSDKPVKAQGSNGEYTLSIDLGDKRFAADDTYAQIFVQEWWGKDITVKSVKLMAGGKELGAAAPAPAPDKAPKTGDATSIALLSAIALLAVAGVVVTSKKANN